jgi:hypothetical protein
MRSRPVDISFLEEARNTLSYRYSSFHVINRPQPEAGLKYFMRLQAIGLTYSVAPLPQASCPGSLKRRSDTRISFLLPP